MLTEHTLKKFDKWYHSHVTNKNLSEHAVTSFFHTMDFRLKWGMLDAFFNKHGLFPEVLDRCFDEPKLKGTDERFHTVVRTHEKWIACGFHKSKITAQKEAIEVANEKFNSKYL